MAKSGKKRSRSIVSVVVYTNHNPQLSLVSNISRLIRWSLLLQSYWLDVRHIRAADSVINMFPVLVFLTVFLPPTLFPLLIYFPSEVRKYSILETPVFMEEGLKAPSFVGPAPRLLLSLSLSGQGEGGVN